MPLPIPAGLIPVDPDAKAARHSLRELLTHIAITADDHGRCHYCGVDTGSEHHGDCLAEHAWLLWLAFGFDLESGTTQPTSATQLVTVAAVPS